MGEKVLIKGEFSRLNVFAITCFSIAVWAFYMGLMLGEYFIPDWFFIGAVVLFVMGIIFAAMKSELIVTDGKVTGKTLFGKRVDLPISQISVIGTGAGKRVSIATSSGSINFYGVKNRDEVLATVSKLLLKRQEDTITTFQAPKSTSDELKKLKELLDMGIITQEEFEAKKKQLLGL